MCIILHKLYNLFVRYEPEMHLIIPTVSSVFYLNKGQGH